MSTRKLKRIRELGPTVVEQLAKQNVTTCKDLLNKSHLELMKILGMGHHTVKVIVFKASLACAPKPRTALDLLTECSHNRPGHLPTSLRHLDKLLRGGLPARTITEIAGPSGCGKTQFSMMLSVLATMPPDMGGFGGGVLYIDTEAAFSAERLVEIAQNRFPERFSSEDDVVALTSRVHIHLEKTCASLMNRLDQIENELIQKDIGLVVVDSIASLVRKEFDSRSTRNIIDRTNLLARQAAILKYIAETYHIPGEKCTVPQSRHFIRALSSTGGLWTGGDLSSSSPCVSSLNTV